MPPLNQLKVHKKCKDKVGALCGLDQKMLADELSKLGLNASELSGNEKKLGGSGASVRDPPPPPPTIHLLIL